MNNVNATLVNHKNNLEIYVDHKLKFVSIGLIGEEKRDGLILGMDTSFYVTVDNTLLGFFSGFRDTLAKAIFNDLMDSDVKKAQKDYILKIATILNDLAENRKELTLTIK